MSSSPPSPHNHHPPCFLTPARAPRRNSPLGLRPWNREAREPAAFTERRVCCIYCVHRVTRDLDKFCADDVGTATSKFKDLGNPNAPSSTATTFRLLISKLTMVEEEEDDEEDDDNDDEAEAAGAEADGDDDVSSDESSDTVEEGSE
ncbi:hypothetical protein O1611_g944 [Lasiodiplodia mahajangana]|uniref:Uncharacterized protein n=1 Tax=Lasiodiplodia mahajangana TaxID=1108764 RepID=A0ACC2JZ56_9PEZI|nr:hypothetical protein O1611_g944 [Lasiodiplodia mahajangana]